ncbi:MAG: alpha/beta hydrolase-fold protein [Gammaproteobacteria bacterium]|jgi:enterochelin esterase family protein
MNEDLKVLLGDGPPDPETVDRFIDGREFPLVDARGVTFLYRGEADTVLLQHWVYGLPSSQPLERVPETDLWHLFLELPPRSRIEYKFDVVKDGNNHWITDPLNPLTAEDPFGRNSVCRAYGYERPAWTVPDSGARPGVIEAVEFHSRHLEGPREVLCYLPARFRRNRRYPLLVVHDGADFLRFADLKAVLDNLIERLEIPPMIVAMTEAGDRLREYAGDPRHASFIAEELLPGLQDRLPLEDNPSRRALMGASFGAVASLATAWQYPGLFNRLLLLSGSFAFSDIGTHRRGPAFDPVVEFMNRFRRRPGRPARRIYLACGIYESLIYENRSIVPLLQANDIRVRFQEVRDGHNWENWRDRLRDGLSWLLPGPLWMIYE